MIRLLAFLVLAGALAGYAFWVYFRAELPVRRARILAALRAASLLVLLAVVWDVRLPWGGLGVGGDRWALLDVSASMGAGTAWDDARARAAALEAEGWRVVPFGEGVEATAEAPSATTTELGPALVRAAEAGVAEVRVLSDFRLRDPVATSAALGTLPLPVAFEAFGGATVNAGVGELTVHDQGRRGDPVSADLVWFAEGVSGPIAVEVREEGALVASLTVEPPSPGRRGRTALELPAARGEGRLRYTARVRVDGDAFAADDEAVAYMNAGYEAGGLVVVSLRADWEPRALLAVLSEATGLPTSGYLRVGPDRFAPMGSAADRGAPVDSATVRRAAGDAALLVLHGLDAATDAWGRSLARRPSRVVLWPLDAVGADAAGLGTGGPLPGEWYAADEVPPTPVAADLSGAALSGLPPLSAVLPLDGAAPSVAPILVRPGGTGPARPALVLDQREGGRRAVALASGSWRWAARGGEGLDAYRRLWSGVAGWLLAEDAGRTAVEVRPEDWVAAPGEPVAWRVPGGPADTVRLELLDTAGAALLDTLLAGGRVFTGPHPPGAYRYRAARGDEGMGEGRFDVEARSEEMLPVPGVPEGAPGLAAALPAGEGVGTPLRTTVWPYLLLLVLLSAEWVGRRRAGLR